MPYRLESFEKLLGLDGESRWVLNSSNKGTENSLGVAVVLPSAGYLNDTVSPANVTVDYVGAVLSADETDTKINGEIVYSYTLATP